MNKKVAIIFLGDYLYDARCINMADSLVNSNVCVDVFHSANKKRLTNKQNLNFININCPYVGGWKKFVFWCYFVRLELNKKDYDYILAADLYSLLPVNFYKKNCKIIYDCRDLFTELDVLKKKRFKQMLWKALERFSLRRVNVVLTTAFSDKKHIERRYSGYKLQHRVVLNFPGVYSFHNPQIKDIKALKQRYKIILYQGVIQKNRGIKTMLKLIKQNKDIAGLFVGSGQKTLFIKYAQDLGVDNRTIFFDRVPYKQLLRITKEADVGCVLIKPTSLNNILALPNKLFEYAACSVPVLASNLPNLVKYIKRYHLGYYENIYNVKQLNGKLRLALSKPNKQLFNEKNCGFLSWKIQNYCKKQ